MFFVTVTAVWLLAHLYLAKRLIGPLRVSKRRRIGLWLGALGAVLLTPVGITLGRLSEATPVRVVEWAGYLYVGLVGLVFPFLVGRDAVAATWGSASAVHRRIRPRADPPDPARRRFLTNASNATALGASAVIGSWGVQRALAQPEVHRVEIPIENLPEAFDGYRIAQITDLHVGPTIRRDFVGPIVDTVNRLEPDLVAVTGDLADGYVPELRPHAAPLGRLRGRDGVFLVTGNHEYYWDLEGWLAELERLGMRTLRNTHHVLERGRARVLLGGVTDYREGGEIAGETSDPEGALRGAPAHDARILLAHQPGNLAGAIRAGYDVQISGHTHGGQFFPWSLLVGHVHRVGVGLARIGGTWIYVSRGAGYWGPPQRAGVPSEIPLLTLRRKG